MTDHDPKKTRPRPAKAPQMPAFTKAGPLADDPFDDEQLDALLAGELPGTSEARLLIVDRLLNRWRIRREV